MNVKYSKNFQKAYRKQSGKTQKQLAAKIKEVKNASSIEYITDCKRLIGFSKSYRLRINDLRTFFVLQIEENTVCFEYLVSRGKAYSKQILGELRRKEK